MNTRPLLIPDPDQHCLAKAAKKLNHINSFRNAMNAVGIGYEIIVCSPTRQEMTYGFLHKIYAGGIVVRFDCCPDKWYEFQDMKKLTVKETGAYIKIA